MITITDKEAIAAANSMFEPGRDGAYATGRCLPGHWEQDNCQEWAERGTIVGVPAKVYYLFQNDEVAHDGADMPWDSDHVIKIEVAEQDEDGNYELL